MPPNPASRVPCRSQLRLEVPSRAWMARPTLLSADRAEVGRAEVGVGEELAALPALLCPHRLSQGHVRARRNAAESDALGRLHADGDAVAA
jgi:hypothetical protein